MAVISKSGVNWKSFINGVILVIHSAVVISANWAFQQTERRYAQFAGTTEYMLPGLTAMYAQFAGLVNKQQQFSSSAVTRNGD